MGEKDPSEMIQARAAAQLVGNFARWTTNHAAGAIYDSHSMQVLLVEDHADTRSVLSTLLNRCGCRTVTAKNLQEARSRLKEMPFEILIADLNLPDGDGLQLVREAKKLQSLKAIALTGRDSEDDRRTGVEAGFDCYLTKPIDFHELRKAISS